MIRKNKINAIIGISKNLNDILSFEDFSFSLILPLEKEEASNLINYINLALKFMEKVQSKTNILVVCSDGKSLSPIILMAFLIKYFNYNFSKTYEAFVSNRQILDKNTIYLILSKVFPDITINPSKLKPAEELVLKDRTNLLSKIDIKDIEMKKTDCYKLDAPNEKPSMSNFNKVHSIESYRKNIEPELKFEDVNCIVQPNENNVGGIYLGNFNAAKDLNLLKKLNISAVLTVAEELELSYKSNEWMVAHLKIMASDVENFDLSKYFLKCFEFICQFQRSTNVLIHCYAGVSRSVTITIAYLMKFFGMSFKKSFSLVRENRKQIYPNSGFIKQLKSFETLLQWEQRTIIN